MTSPASDPTIAREFVQFALQAGVLRFGAFKTKAGRLSPYFFNSGLFDDGVKLMRLGEFYARRLVASGLVFDMRACSSAPRSRRASSAMRRTSKGVRAIEK